MYLHVLLFVSVNVLYPVNNAEAEAVPKTGSASSNGEKYCKKIFDDERFAECKSPLKSALRNACAWDYLFCKDEPTQCACEIINQYAKYCVSLGVSSLKKWRDENICPLKCTGGRVQLPCAPKEERTCKTTESVDDTECEERCHCPVGSVLDNDVCVPEEQCPCTSEGKEYKNGSKISKGCNSCVCKKSKWECTDFPCNKTCAAVGDPHYTTFDGRRFDFMGNCSYYLVKTNNFEVIGENAAWNGGYVPYRPGLPTWTKSVTVNVKRYKIKINQGNVVTINGKLVERYPHSVSKITIFKPSLNDVAVQLKGATVRFNGLYNAFITLPRSYSGKTKGLCGDYNDKFDDDFKTPLDVVVDSINDFGNSWKTETSCLNTNVDTNHPCDVNPQSRKGAEEGCEVIKSSIFSECHKHINPEDYYKDCIFDTCACAGDVSICMCPMIKAYADVCMSKGVLVDWRKSTDQCPMKCPEGQIYELCAKNCRRTCHDISANVTCSNECIEDCRCPTGQVLDSTGRCSNVAQCSCLLHNKEHQVGQILIRNGQTCTCTNARWKCKRVCEENQTIYEDCNKCKCINKKWDCTHNKCPTDGCTVGINNGTQPNRFLTPGKVWDKDPCMKCTCVKDITEYRLDCKTENCPKLPIDTENFVYEDEKRSDECCPRLKRIACKYGDKEYKEGQSRALNPCTRETCMRNGNGELVKSRYDINCNTNCEQGYVYETSPTSCCGRCVQNACIAGDEIRNAGESWVSTDGCTTNTCEKFEDDFVVFTDDQNCKKPTK